MRTWIQRLMIYCNLPNEISKRKIPFHLSVFPGSFSTCNRRKNIPRRPGTLADRQPQVLQLRHTPGKLKSESEPITNGGMPIMEWEAEKPLIVGVLLNMDGIFTDLNYFVLGSKLETCFGVCSFLNTDFSTPHLQNVGTTKSCDNEKCDVFAAHEVVCSIKQLTDQKSTLNYSTYSVSRST